MSVPVGELIARTDSAVTALGLAPSTLWAVSIRRSNIGCEEGFEFFSWGVEAKGCSGAVVEFISDRVEVGLVAGDVGPLG